MRFEIPMTRFGIERTLPKQLNFIYSLVGSSEELQQAKDLLRKIPIATIRSSGLFDDRLADNSLLLSGKKKEEAFKKYREIFNYRIQNMDANVFEKVD